MSMKKDAKIYVAGHLGLAGSAIVRKLSEKVVVTLFIKLANNGRSGEAKMPGDINSRVFFHAHS